ncbi:MAG: hypothetical protein IT373_20155 [Polyangiaceae bacterium]|nr:hypothetical protein [Polyangiaceae bacterium]
MVHATRCRIAELIGTTLAAQGIRPLTEPLGSLASVVGSLFERRVAMVPVDAGGRRRSPAGVILAVGLFCLLVAGIVVLPLELWRGLRASRFRRRMAARWEALRTELGPSGYRERTGPLSRASELVAVDYRVEHDGRACLAGAALVALEGDDERVVWLGVHRGARPRPDALDADTLAAALVGAPTPVTTAHWTWHLRDPYELEERSARPW